MLVFGVFSKDVHVSAIELEHRPDGDLVSSTHFPAGLTVRSLELAPGEYCWVRAAVNFFDSGYELDAYERGEPLLECFTVKAGETFHWGVIRFDRGGFKLVRQKNL